MSRHLHLDPVSGIAGDMLLGLLVELGLKNDVLGALPKRLGLEDVSVEVERVVRGSVTATKVHVRVRGWEEKPDGGSPAPGGSPRHLREMLELLERAALPEAAASRARRTLELLFEAEARVHGQAVEEVHLHEAGADDALVDIVGGCLGLVELGIESVSASTPIPVGAGTIRCSHGTLPVPVPAVTTLLEGLETVGGPIARELVTPTGAALLRALVDDFGPQPAMRVIASGFGAGTREQQGLPNVLRGTLGEANGGPLTREISLVSTTLDDLHPQDLPVLIERLLESGALDAWTQTVQMKKGRLGIVVTAVCRCADEREIGDVLLHETPSLGVRIRRERRLEWPRDIVMVETRWGPIRIKQARDDAGRILRGVPEFEDCREAARRAGVGIDDVRSEARERYRRCIEEPGSDDG